MISDVLKTDPEWAALPAGVPTVVRSLLRRCLQKDPSRRLRDAADARFQIEEALSDSGDATAGRSTAFPALPRRAWWVAAVIIASAAAVAVSLWFSRRPVPDPEEVRFEIDAPPTIEPTSIALSPDGKIARLRSDIQQAVAPVGATIEYGLGKTVGGNGKREASYSGRPTAAPSDSPQMLSSSALISRVALCRVLASGGALAGAWNRDGTILFNRSPAARSSASPPRAANRVKLR